MEKKQRIWELDALRGLCILGVLVVHFVFDLTFFGNMELNLPHWFRFIKENGYILFVLISGICVTFGSSSLQRGLTVFGGGLLVSYVTLFLDLVLGFSETRIWFGILHMLGICMMLYPLFRRFPAWGLALTAAVCIGLGYWFRTFRVPVDFLFPFGLRSGNIFTGSDFFPLFPGLGWFLAGAFLGKTLYRDRKTLLPGISSENPILRFLQSCGRHSLWIYLLHQPVLAGLTLLLTAF